MKSVTRQDRQRVGRRVVVVVAQGDRVILMSDENLCHEASPCICADIDDRLPIWHLCGAPDTVHVSAKRGATLSKTIGRLVREEIFAAADLHDGVPGDGVKMPSSAFRAKNASTVNCLFAYSLSPRINVLRQGGSS